MVDERRGGKDRVANPERLIEELLDRYGRTFAEELGIPAEKGTPSPLFRLLCASLLFSARISSDIAMRAARALAEQGWTTAQKLARSTWEERTRTLNQAGYARYDERTSSMLGDTTGLLLDKYSGDLRQLRRAAERHPARERRLLKEFKGMGDVGADIFFREVQVAWDELRPFADDKALRAAKHLGLGNDTESLVGLVPAKDFPRLVAALVRVDLAGDHEEVRQAAEGS